MKFAWEELDDEQVEVNYYDPNPNTCMFGEQVELANFGEKVTLVNEQRARQDGYIFGDEKQVYVFGMDNC
eukprot:14431031-Ditylum_brightwellii.AAC.1